MLVVGLFAVLSWNSTFPDRRDLMVIAPLPVRARTLFLAKIAAVGTALGITVAVLHVIAGLAWPLAFDKQFPAQSMPALTSDPAIGPVEASQFQSVLDHDMDQMLRAGALAPGTGAGVAIGVSKHGVRRVFTYGTARPDSLFEIGSISKTFTGLVLARMIKQGKVSLGEPVRELLPGGTVAKPTGTEITLLDLVTQHSGLPRMPNNFHPADKTNPYADYHAADLYEYVAQRGLRKPSNASFLYSNLGFGLLGQALADRAGTNYPTLLEQEVAGPLGLRNTTISLSPEQQRRFIQGHDEDHHAVHAWDLDALAGAGGIRSTAGDMLTYLEANLHPEKLSSAELRAAVASSHQLRADVAPGLRIAFAWFYNLHAGTYGHNGATQGYSSFAFFNPKDDYAGVVLLNSGPGGFSTCDLLGAHIRGRLAGERPISLKSVLIPASGGVFGWMRLMVVYWVTMCTAGVFIFCCVLGLQGWAAQLLPRRYFLRASSFLQLAVFCILVSVYFLQPIVATPDAIRAAQGSGLMAWSPSYWFLGLFQQLNGSPALRVLASRAWIGLAIVVCGTVAAYALSYLRSLRKIVEEPDIVTGARGAVRLPRFGTALQTAVVQFSIRTLLRSRQHRVILAFYLGIGFALTIYLLKSPVAKEIANGSTSDPWHEPSMPLLASTIIMMGFCVVGTRAVFALPLDLAANWIFRITPVRGGSECLSACRRAIWALSVVPVWIGSAVLLFSVWPWRPALEHLLILGLIGVTLAEFCLQGTQKLPFTCSWLPGKSNFHITFWLCIALILQIVLRGAEFERQAFNDHGRYGLIVVVLITAAAVARWRTSQKADSETAPLQFEEEPSWQMVSLNLPSDGGVRTE
jgi:CubicO group peptidase (beta-lactamase class C family)